MRHRGGAELLAPASKAALLKNLSGAHLRWRWSTLAYLLFVQKMFRFFARRVMVEKIGRADVVEQSAISKAVSN